MAGHQDVTVTIYGNRYTLRSSAEPSFIQDLAAQIDERMRAAASGSGQVSADRLAVLVALNLADDLARTQSDDGKDQEETNRRLESLIALLLDEVGK